MVRLIFTVGIPTVSVELLVLAVVARGAAILTVVLLSLPVPGRPASTRRTAYG